MRRVLLTLSLLLFLPACQTVLHGATCSPTETDIEGPYYLPGAPFRNNLTTGKSPDKEITLSGTVFGPDCKTPVPNALIEIWQTGSDGRYRSAHEGYRYRGQFKADGQGRYSFRTVRPGRYELRAGPRPAHIHVQVTIPGYKKLITQLYFKDDPYLAPKDACGPGCKSDDPFRIIELSRSRDKNEKAFEGIFNIVLKEEMR